MYSSLLGIVAFLNTCSARPASKDLSQPSLSPLDRVSGGFPSQYLPIQVERPSLSSTLNSSSDLTLPIKPGQHRDFETRITYIYADRPKGFELASSIATNIHHYWKDISNHRITYPIEARRLPFSNFLHFVQPSQNPDTILNPLKVGLGYCYLLQGIIEKTPASWPGHMGVRMLDSRRPGGQKREIGVIVVDNTPPDAQSPIGAALTVAPDATNNNNASIPTTTTTTDLSTASIPTEKRWLTCFAKILFLFTRHSPSDKLSSDAYFPPATKPVSYNWPCGNKIDEFTMTVLPDASTYALTWDTLVKAMLDWVRGAATEPLGHLFSEDVMDGGVRMAALTIRLGGEAGGVV